ncbi:hypothetical protein [Allochromatium warmingii]|nr:hypothetical protein [Allochromatium warmingii]
MILLCILVYNAAGSVTDPPPHRGWKLAAESSKKPNTPETAHVDQGLARG